MLLPFSLVFKKSLGLFFKMFCRVIGVKKQAVTF